MRFDQEKEIDRLIDQALREFPLEPVPERLKAKIMGQLDKPLPASRFRISWLDLVFSGALALISGFALDFIQGIARSPYWSTRFRVELILFWQDVRFFLIHNQSPIMAALLSTGVVLSVVAVLISVYWRYTAKTDIQPA